MMEKTVFVVLETIDIHAGLACLDRPARATMTNRNANIAHLSAVEAIVGKHLKMLFFGIQFEDTGTLRTTQLYGLGGDDLEDAIQFQGGSNDRGDAVNSGQFMHFAPQLFVCLFVKPPVFAVDGNDARNDFDEIHFFGCEITRFETLNADDADKTLDVAKKDDGQDDETTIFRAIGTSFGGEICVGNGIMHE